MNKNRRRMLSGTTKFSRRKTFGPSRLVLVFLSPKATRRDRRRLSCRIRKEHFCSETRFLIRNATRKSRMIENCIKDP